MILDKVNIVASGQLHGGADVYLDLSILLPSSSTGTRLDSDRQAIA